MLAFWLYKSIIEPKTIFFVFQIILMFLLFYIKFNTALISFLIFIPTISYLLIIKKINLKKFLILLFTPLIIILITANFFNVSLWGFVIYGIDLITGYNEIMYLGNKSFGSILIYPFLFILSGAIFFLFNINLKKEEIIKRVVQLFIFLIISFVFYKQCYVRGDEQHINSFFKRSSFLILCVVPFLNSSFKQLKSIALIPLVVIPVILNIKNNNLESFEIDILKKKLF